MSRPRLERDFYLQSAVPLAKALLGKTLVHVTGGVAAGGIIVETEAYAGREDAACHSYKREGPSGGHRTDVMFGPGGYAYVYLIYGMYNCFNVVANVENEPEAVLIRALEPREGIAAMRERRKTQDVKKLCGGPGKLSIALGITREHWGMDLRGDRLFITEGQAVPANRILVTPRINVDYAGEAALFPYRFAIRDSEFLSARVRVRKSPPERRVFAQE
ncbi:MAG: DNA-3-methyladenine glycosylase [Synergistaceae bacterium]|jgi:DNA-3-methyladenine glycosylase|nr:DNA-3-methyladenine glycosylase [Synergistaceae bacterium]